MDRTAYKNRHIKEHYDRGANPDDYFKPVEPQRATVYYFVTLTACINGKLHLKQEEKNDIV